MKLMFVALAALLGATATTNVAEAQWGERRAPRSRTHTYEAWRPQLAASAHAMSEEAEHLAYYLRAGRGRGRLAADAAALAQLAELFHRSVEAGVPPHRLVRELRQVGREHDRLVRRLQAGRRLRHVEVDLRTLTQAYRATASLLGRIEASSPTYQRAPYAYAPDAYEVRSRSYRARQVARPRFEIHLGRR